jgi:23S rRNA (uracil1939-C5)-methyltransferase
MTTLEVELGPVVAGGDALAREEGGRVVFVRGGLAGERVRIKYSEQKKDYARADIIEVVTPSRHRVPVACEHARAGCGGCGWMHASVDGQREMKRAIVTEALQRTGKIADPVVLDGPVLPAVGFRTSLRMVVIGDRLGFRQARSHDAIGIDHCLVAHPLLADIITHGRFPGVEEVSLRVGVSSGERSVLLHPGIVAAKQVLPDGVRVGPRSVVHEEVAGRTFRVTATSFFQTRTDGAAALVTAVGEAVGPLAGRTFIDAYGGVGLFASTLGESASVVSIEESPSSSQDAKANLADLDATVVCSSVERWAPTLADVVIADPSRKGLGAAAVSILTGTKAERFVLVACDPVALARDAALLSAKGYSLVSSTLIDLFPHTPHIEVVARFDRR